MDYSRKVKTKDIEETLKKEGIPNSYHMFREQGMEDGVKRGYDIFTIDGVPTVIAELGENGWNFAPYAERVIQCIKAKISTFERFKLEKDLNQMVEDAIRSYFDNLVNQERKQPLEFSKPASRYATLDDLTKALKGNQATFYDILRTFSNNSILDQEYLPAIVHKQWVYVPERREGINIKNSALHKIDNTTPFPSEGGGIIMQVTNKSSLRFIDKVTQREYKLYKNNHLGRKNRNTIGKFIDTVDHLAQFAYHGHVGKRK